MDRHAAETFALKALAFLAADADAFERFLTNTGLDLADLRERAHEPELLAAVLDFLLGDDALLTAFAEAENVDPAFLHTVRRALPGATEF
jgi:hypothetical protein